MRQMPREHHARGTYVKVFTKLTLAETSRWSTRGPFELRWGLARGDGGGISPSNAGSERSRHGQ